MWQTIFVSLQARRSVNFINHFIPKFLMRTFPSLNLDRAILTNGDQSKRKTRVANWILMRWLIMSHLIWLCTVCKSIWFGLQGRVLRSRKLSGQLVTFRKSSVIDSGNSDSAYPFVSVNSIRRKQDIFAKKKKKTKKKKTKKKLNLIDTLSGEAKLIFLFSSEKGATLKGKNLQGTWCAGLQTRSYKKVITLV